VDLAEVQKMVEAHYAAAAMPNGIVDARDGAVLAGAGWQDICTLYHRANPATLARCRESDLAITGRLKPGEAYAYKCRNGLWDIGIPIMAKGRHLATLFLGQFFYEGEDADTAFFAKQAEEFGFDKAAYLDAVARVPVFSREKVENILAYNTAFAGFLGRLAENALDQRERLEDSRRSRQALQESEQRFRAIADYSFDWESWLDNDGRLLWVNPAVERITGRSPAECMAMADYPLPLVHPEHRETVRNAMSQGLSGQPGNNVPFQIIDAAGENRWVAISWNPVTADGGSRNGLRTSIRDIDERKRAVEALRESEERYRRIVETTSEGVWTMDAGHRTTHVNEVMARMLGFTPEEMLGRKVEEFFFPEDLEQHTREMAGRHVGKSSRYERRFRRKDGGEVWTLVSGTPILDASGAFCGSFGMFSDITERKRAREALQESEERYRRIVETAREGIRICDASGRILYLNQRMADILGFTREQMLGRNIEEYVFPEDLEDHRRRMGERRDGKDDSYERKLRRSDGTAVWTLVSSKSLRDAQGRYEGTLAMFSDITPRKQAEEALRQEETRLRKLVEITQHSAPDIQSLLDFALEKCLELTGSRFGYIYHYNEDTRTFTLNSWSREVMQTCTITKPQTCYELANTGIWGEAVRQRSPVILNDFQADHPLKKGYPEGHAPLTRFLTVPVLSNARIVAVVGVANKQSDYSDNDVLQLTLLMDTAWRVVERRQAEEEARSMSLFPAENPNPVLRMSRGGAVAYANAAGQKLLAEWGAAPGQDLPAAQAALFATALDAPGPRDVEFMASGRTYLAALAPFPDRGYVNAYLVDITERKRAEDALRRSEGKLRHILERVPLIGLSLDTQGRLTFANDHFLKLTGWTREEALGRDWFDTFIPPEHREEIRGVFAASITTKDVWDYSSYVNDILARDGRRLTVAWANVLAKDLGGDMTDLTCLGVDLTERSRAEKLLLQAKEAAEAANRAKGEFLANMSHELRTPLNGVLGMLQLLDNNSCIANDDKVLLETAMESGRGLLAIINDILSFAQFDAGKLAIAREPADLREIVNSLCRAFQYEVEERGLTLEAAVDDSVPGQVLSDTGRLRQILLNLITNALKFTSGGRVEVGVCVLPISPSPADRMLLVSVSDAGIGIPDDKLDVIFEPFTQVDGSLTRKYKGTGIGLGIVRQLAHLMGGSVCVDSAVGVGTTFYVTIRCGWSLLKPAAETASQAEQAGDIAGLRVLVAEDDRVNLFTATRFLERLGCAATGAGDGREAVALLEREDFDCILMDVQMPEMDGVKATRAIRSSAALGPKARIPIIAMTAHAMPGDREQFLAAGMDGYLSKPVDMDELERVLAKVALRAGER